uniref:small monomeric GTPase n=1 Tax=Oncorhynchus kisutch TaxID=8019 RepID=A0A8C7G6J5_ONCKI
MVVQVKPSSHHCSKTIEGTQQIVEANILLHGAENFGKSALTVRFITRRFIGEYGEIESIYSHIDTIDEREISFNILDSLYVFLRQQVQRIRHASRKMSTTAPIIIVGNKRDLQHGRTVSSGEGRLLAISEYSVFFEISAVETYHGVLLSRVLRKGAAGIKSIVRSLSTVFGKKRAE